MVNRSTKRSTWKEVKKGNDDFLEIFPEFKKRQDVISTLNMMSLWEYQSRLKNEKRFLELVWIQPNLTEITINAMLSAFFLVITGDKKRKNDNDSLINSFNLQHKIKLLYSLNLIDKKMLHLLENYRTTRNFLIHKLMKQVQIGKDIDKECERFCQSGFELQNKLHDLLMEFVRKQAKLN